MYESFKRFAGIYGEVLQAEHISVQNAAVIDSGAGVLILMGGSSSLDFVRSPQSVNISDSVFVGRSTSSSCARSSAPGLYACQHYMAWCSHLGPRRFGVIMSNFFSAKNMAPKIFPWDSVDSYPELLGRMDLARVTFARFGEVGNRNEYVKTKYEYAHMKRIYMHD